MASFLMIGVTIIISGAFLKRIWDVCKYYEEIDDVIINIIEEIEGH